MSGGVAARVRDFASLVKLSHSVFALPFALLSLLVATDGAPSPRLLALVIAAVVAARTAAMAFNRWADRGLDAENPRTSNREIPRGAMTALQVLTFAICAGAAFLLCCALLSTQCFWLGVPTLLWLYGYSYAKRFSALCHLWLGVALGLSPVAAWFAADGAFGARMMTPLALGVAVAMWVGGFDVLYACQDEDFDRARGLHSMPVWLGRRAAMWASRCMHVTALIGFAAFGWLAALGVGYACGLVLAAGLLFWQHRLLRPEDLSRIQMAFFTANGALAVVMFAAGAVDLYL